MQRVSVVTPINGQTPSKIFNKPFEQETATTICRAAIGHSLCCFFVVCFCSDNLNSFKALLHPIKCKYRIYNVAGRKAKGTNTNFALRWLGKPWRRKHKTPQCVLQVEHRSQVLKIKQVAGTRKGGFTAESKTTIFVHLYELVGRSVERVKGQQRKAEQP